MIQIGDRVQVGSRIGADLAWAVVVNILPAIGDRVAMYCVRFDATTSKLNECWIDEGMIYGPFLDQNFGWN
ncbi:MAG: hypothetical protein EBY16_07385 [Gammaproteobacteria bacterium]|nr:hypothetical protein [Gammaproteobacteria bacterium]